VPDDEERLINASKELLSGRSQLGRREQLVVLDDPLTLPIWIRAIDFLSAISKGW